MKRGTPEHPKVYELADRLGISRVHAVGVLECLWHFAARYSPQGDIGKHSNRRITSAVEMDIVSPDEFVEILVAVGWLDQDLEHRLVVHDWNDHADQGVRLHLRNKGLSLVSPPSAPRDATPSAHSEKAMAMAMAMAPAKAPEANGVPTSADRYEARPLFDKLKPVVPARLRPGPTAIVDAIAEKLRDGVDGQHIIDRVAQYYASPHSRGECPWRLKAFVRDGHYDDEADAWETGPVKPPDPTLTRTPEQDAERVAEMQRERAQR